MTTPVLQQPSLRALKPFIMFTDKNYELTKAFYSEFFKQTFDNGKSACGYKIGDEQEEILVTLHHNIEIPKNAMLQFVVDDPQAWYDYMVAKKLGSKYDITITPPVKTSWGWLITYVSDPAGVKLHFGAPL